MPNLLYLRYVSYILIIEVLYDRESVKCKGAEEERKITVTHKQKFLIKCSF